MGLFMKSVAADRAAIAVDTVFGKLGDSSGAEVLFASFLFAIQIYADFAGYSLIAKGAASFIGIDVSKNFDRPYFSTSVSEFWRRWHISLNTWLTDYIYIPLGGSRCSDMRRYFNVMVVFAVSGLWHGANTGYIIWGVLNGCYVIAETMLRKRFGIPKKAKDAKYTGKSVLQSIVTFVLIQISWVFFRAQTLRGSLTAFSRLADPGAAAFFRNFSLIFESSKNEFLGMNAYQYIVLGVSLIILFITDIASAKNKDSSAKKIATGNTAVRWIVLYILLFSVICFGIYGYGYNAASFIYTQF